MLRLLPLICAATACAVEPWTLPDPLCCAQDYERRAIVATGGVDPAGISVRVDPPGVLAASCRPLDTTRLEIRLSAHAAGGGTLELLDATRTVRLRRRVQVVALTTDSERHIGTEARLPDGSDVFIGNLILKPYVPRLDVRFACLAGNVTVPDGLSERWIASETFVPNPDGSEARATFRMVREPGGRWVPFTYIVYQDGEQISPP